ncbi:MAG: hypothetical protein ACR2P1_27830 [Pseudomonadales bacterium]
MKSHLSERVYLASPVIVQNLLVSLYGLLEHNNRYKGVYNALSEELFKNEFMSKAELEEVENSLLEKAIKNALNNVPHYQALNIPDARIESFPVLSRAEVFNDPESFVAKQYRNTKLIALYTGGSTGNPLKVFLNKDVRRKSYAFWNRFYRLIGFRIGEKKATFVGRKVQEPDNSKPPFWRYNMIDRQLMFSSFHLSKENIPLYIKKLNQFKPAIVEGYPLSILQISQYLIDNGIELDFIPKGISTSSENFSAQQRATIENSFKCNVFDQYGSAESVVFASDCEYKNKHIAIEYGMVEVIDEAGDIKREGDGELIVTSFLNDVMPLIRYRIGDLGKVSCKKCKCNRNTPILEELHGKVGAYIVAGDKRVSAASLAIAFEYLKNVKKSQIIQNEPEQAVVKLVVTPEFNQEEEDFMLWELMKMLGNDFGIELQKVDAIPPAKNGKYQMVVQNYYKD